MRLNDRVILVTGASSGIGLAASRALAARGARVVMAARSGPRLEQAAAGVPGAVPLVLDVTADVDGALATLLARFERIDVVINNAGNGGQLGRLQQLPSDHARRLFDVHVLGMERLVRAVLPIMLRQGHGRIVNVASTVGYVPMPGAAAYSAAKAAVIAFTQALRGELAGAPVELALYSPPHTQTEAGKAWPLDLPKQFSPQFAADALVRSLERDQLDVLAGGNRPLLWLQRLWPALASRIMRGIGLRALAKLDAAASCARG